MTQPYNINTSFDPRDFDQLTMLARINKIKRTEVVRRIVRAHLDGIKARLKESTA